MHYLKMLSTSQRLIMVRNRRKVSMNVTAMSAAKSKEAKNWTEIPGPKKLPVIGSLREFLPGGSLHKKNIEEIFQYLHNTYGPIVRLDGSLGSPSTISLTDPESAATILRGENWTPVRDVLKSLEYYRKTLKKSKDDPERLTGLLTENYERWRQVRSIVNPVLMERKNIEMYSSSLAEVADDMIARMRLKRNKNYMLDGKFDYEMNLWALESTGVVALGTRLNCFDTNLAVESPVNKLIKCSHDALDVLENIEFKPDLWRYFSTPLYRRAMAIYDHQYRLCEYFIDKSLSCYEHEARKLNSKKSVLQRLMEKDPKIAYTMASDMLMAGIDTTAHALMGVLYLLANNPEKQEKLREEIFSNTNQLRYLKACLKESLRVMPIAGANVRVTTKEYNILGYKIPNEMTCIFFHKIMSQRADHYSEPDKFIPERWLSDKSEKLSSKNAHPFSYLPFGYGTRQCIGRRLAELELETFLVRFLQSFKVEWIGPSVRTKFTAISRIVGPYNYVYKDL